MADAVFLEQAAPDDLIAVGRVATAHGVHGWLKIQPYTTQGSALLSAKTWWFTAADMTSGASARGACVLACQQGGAYLLAQIKGVSDRDAALALRGWSVWASRQAFPAPQTDEYYWVDLIGCRFYGLSGTATPVLLGQVDEVFDNSAHAVLQVALGEITDADAFQPRLDSKGRPCHVLVPFVAAHVHHVDLQARRIDSDWPAEF